MSLPSLLEADLGINAESHLLLFASEPVLEAPVLATVGTDQQVQTTTVSELSLSLTGLGVVYRTVIELHTPPCVGEHLRPDSGVSPHLSPRLVRASP